MLRVHGLKSDETQFIQFFEEQMVHAVIDRYFALFLKGFEYFS